ncbi:hypothetical protein J0X19_06175 [Hymenobacter sp. BT186]|uniref:Uncharacterized protein n=1 Tax=Hymenobacter telluris TaxID=2816474 RepID=A0A939EU22_9BACT|nr:hypothetical protein [Hymenobacter telluris]MBO0357525.1 hypothetical protein [Hymenobacter telluris]MBW3373551.1 hypothetical protein [Hymenobacter norwichensis]
MAIVSALSLPNRITLFTLTLFYTNLLLGCEHKKVKKIPISTLPKPRVLNTILFQDKEYIVEGPAQHHVTIVRAGSSSSALRSGMDTLFHNESIAVIGDTALRGSSLYVSRKFSYRYSFAEFPAKASFRSNAVAPDFTTNKQAKRHITRIKESAQQPANFAGHYRLVTWGCGSNCQQSVLVDQRTGRIYDAPETALGLSYQLTSRLLITDYYIDSEDQTYLVNSAYPIPEFYEWTGSRFQKLN